MNKYYDLLDKLRRREGLTMHGFAVRCGMPSLSTIAPKLKKVPNKKLHPETIGKLERTLKIKIDDTGDAITYTENIAEERGLKECKEEIESGIQKLKYQTELVEDLVSELEKSLGAVAVLNRRLNDIIMKIGK